MVREFKLPDVGEGLTEAEIVDWLVEVGDTVTEDQPVAEVETDKAVVEVPSPVNGTVREIRADAGAVVPVGEVIITFDVEGEEPPDEAGEDAEPDTEPAVAAVEEAAGAAPDAGGTAQRGGRTFAAPAARRLARELEVDIGSVPGAGPGGRVTEQDVRAYAEAAEAEADAGAAPEPAVQSATKRVTDDAGSDPATATPSSVEAAGRDQTLAAPATRRLADEEGVNLDDVPTDETRDGEAFVTAEQVREYAAAQQAAQEADAEAVQADPSATAEPSAESTAADTGEGAIERVPYRGVRRTIGNAMEQSKYTAPHVTHHEELVVEELVAMRERLKPAAKARDSKLTYMPFIVKAVIAALKKHPILNSQLDEEAEEILVKHYYNIGIAVATDAGLMVPVVKDADGKDMLTLADEVRNLASKARDRSIAREEMQDGTFSITNFGAVGGDYATPIINYPETAILGLGALKQRPVVEEGEVVARHTLPLSLSIDHRVVDGADAARFVNTLAEYLENPELLLLE